MLVEVLGRLSARGVPGGLWFPASSLLLPLCALPRREWAPLFVLICTLGVRRRLLTAAVGLLASLGALEDCGTRRWLPRSKRLLVISGGWLIPGNTYELLWQWLSFIVLALIDLARVLGIPVFNDVVVLRGPHL